MPSSTYVHHLSGAAVLLRWYSLEKLLYGVAMTTQDAASRHDAVW